MNRSLEKKFPSPNLTGAVRRASGRVAALVILFLFSATVLSYGVWGIDRLIFYLVGTSMDLELYGIFASIVPTIIGALCAVLAAKKFTGFNVKVLITPRRIQLWIIILSFGLCLGLNLATSFFTDLLTQWLNQQGVSVSAPDFSYSLDTPFLSFILIAYSCFIAPILEEVIFRGYILQSLQQFGNGFAIVFSSLLFGIYHFDLTQLLPAFAMGCLFGYLVTRCGSLLPSILVHALNNIIAVLISTFSSFLTETVLLIINIALYTFIFICFIVAAFLYRQVCRRPQLHYPDVQLTTGKTFIAAISSPIWILLLVLYFYQVLTKLIPL